MLHIVRNSPFDSHVLDECLALMGEGDRLLLLQDGVIAACVATRTEQFAQTAVIPYVLAEDLLARGLKPVTGEVIDMAGFVRLVVDHGTPLRW